MIRKLPAELIREIAAGEVISSPVDVLKELLENALDAGATRLEVTLDSGGVERIMVKDNGAGIPKGELSLAAEAHSTSKLESLAGITTLGFRGEGLYAVRNAARLSLTSRPAQQLGGATLVAEGDAVRQHAHPAPSGTSAEITQLFAQLPARRRALEFPATEGKKAALLLSRYLLHHPNLTLKLFTDGEERWTYAGGSFAEAVKFLWGPVTANRLLTLHAEQTSYTLRGLLSRPELTRPTARQAPLSCQWASRRMDGRTPQSGDERLPRTPAEWTLPRRRSQSNLARRRGLSQHLARQEPGALFAA